MARPPVLPRAGPTIFDDQPAPAAPAPSGRRLVVEADGGSRGNPGPAAYGALVRDAETGQVLNSEGGFRRWAAVRGGGDPDAQRGG